MFACVNDILKCDNEGVSSLALLSCGAIYKQGGSTSLWIESWTVLSHSNENYGAVFFV